MNNWIYKILGGVITLVISLALLPVLQDSIDPLIQEANGTTILENGPFFDTATGTLLQLLPMVLVVVFVILTVTLIPKKNESI